MPVTIRKTLLLAFLSIGLIPALLLAVLAFVTTRDTMQSEIEHSLIAESETVASDVDKMLFERLQNAATWSSLEVMQDLRVQDVDKRISNFLAKLKSGYGGVYSDMQVLDRHARIVASSDSDALGRLAMQRQPWQKTSLSGVALLLDFPDNPSARGVMAIHAPLVSQFDGQNMGELVLMFDWVEIESMLDRAATGGRMIALVDSTGRIFAASRTLRENSALMSAPGPAWQQLSLQGPAFLSGELPSSHTRVVAGRASATGFSGYAGTGLTALVLQPESVALAPLRRLAQASFCLLTLLVLAILWAASRVSAAMAKPILALTAMTRNYRLGQVPVTRIRGARGEVGELDAAFVQMVQDVDLAQHNLVRASKLAAVGEMASVIIHEIRTPLGIMRSSAQMLKREPALSAEARELTGFIESETDRLNRLVSSMLDSARPRALSKTQADMHALISQTAALLQSQLGKRNITLTERFDARNAVLACDTEQLTQVLLNLIMNAIQILPVGGSIALSSADTADCFFIDIDDDGPGIPESERTRVFEAFFCKREGGVGLGLAIVQQIISAHGGSIEARPSALGGAQFHITLPREALTGSGGKQ